MQKVLVFLLAFALTLPSTALAYTQSAPTQEIWKSLADCRSAVAASYYSPTVKVRKTLARGESIGEYSVPHCADIDLPDRMTRQFNNSGHAWVRIAPGTKVVLGSNGSALRLAECNNHIYADAPLDEAVAEPPAPAPEQRAQPEPAPSTPSTFGREERRDEGLVTPPKSSYAEKEPEHRNILERNKGKIISGVVGVTAAAVTVALLRGFPKQEVCVFSNCTSK